MKNLFAFIEELLPGSLAGSQQSEPINWSYTVKKTSATEALLFIKATMANGWRIYSQSADVPVKTAFAFLPSKSFQLIGKTVEPEPITMYEKTYNTNVSYFEKTVVFQQKVKLHGEQQTIVKGNITFMLCSDNQCMAPETTEFSIPVN